MESLSLLVILTALQGCHLQILHVTQRPSASAVPGSSITLECNYGLSSLYEMSAGSFKWYRHVLNGDEISLTNKHYKGRIVRTNGDDFMKKKLANIELQRLELTDTGIYICEVSVISITNITEYGKGTFLNVAGVPEVIHKLNPFIIRVCIIGGILIILISSAVLLKHARQDNSSTKELRPIAFSELKM
ncbi:natural cytotoxicity triggering receptor 3-like [Spea bombifrons]|uniref:natural cytotoxicity triggering receptor 3-like n=1 Tax=Spea bombifrons TaxID=233779 RepID=UPI00234B514F|nr:natural cytotoxicity triggering receptor 3-like [Spea bombifrons]